MLLGALLHRIHRRALVASLALTVTGAVYADDFRYSPPTGFIDLSPGAPTADAVVLPEALLARVKKFRNYAIATDGGVPVAEISVEITPAAGTMENALERYAATAEKSTGQGTVLVRRKDIVQMAGVDCGLLEFDITVAGSELRKISYAVPLGEQRAWIGLDVARENAEAFRPSFEASVRAVRGAKPTDHSAEEGRKWLGILGLALLVGALVAGALRKGKGKGERNAKGARKGKRKRPAD